MKWLPAFLITAVFTNPASSTAQPEGTLHALIRDPATGQRTPCTVAITDANGKLVVENPSFRGGFRSSGEFIKRLPSGRTHIRITRGFETRAIEQDLEIAPGKQLEANFSLERVVDLRRRGWYAGDSHVHMLHGERTIPVDFDFVALTARAEDLQYLSLAQAWTLSDPTPEALQAELERRSTADCRLAWNLEAPKNYYKGDAGRCLGHCWNVGLKGRTREGADVVQMLLQASAWDYESSKPSYANFESHRLIHAQDGTVFYSHPARWWMGAWGGQGGYPKLDRMRVSNMAVELPLDTLVGPTYDGLDVITGAGEFGANAKAFELWCLLLNHGYRLAATASSDACFDRPGGGVPGIPRTYTWLPGSFSLGKVARGTAAGHTFVSTGPLLVAAIDRQPPGSSFASGQKPHQLAVEAWAAGFDNRGLGRVEILRNGQPWQIIQMPEHPFGVQTNLSLVERESAWYCVRVFGRDEQRQVALSGAFSFNAESYRPPAPVRARVHARIMDAESGELVPGRLTELTFEGTVARPGREHRSNTGEEFLSLPGTARLRAEAKGYEPMILSPFLDCPALVRMVTGLSDTDLLDWKTYTRIQEQLADIRLDFRLKKMP